MDNLINYTQKVKKRHYSLIASKKQGKRFFAGFSLLFINIFKSIKNKFKQKLSKNKASYKPFNIQNRISNNLSIKNSLKGQYIILPQKVVNHVSNIIETHNDKNLINLARKSFFKKFKPILVKLSIINIFIITAGLLVFISTSIYSATFVPTGAITLPNDNSAAYLIESFMAVKTASENQQTGSVDLSIIRGGVNVRNHVVARGESISVIAQRYNINQGTIISFNNIQNARLITAGTTLRIPDTNGLFYRVRQGDSLSSIASRHRVNLNDILDINNLDSSVIRPGQELFIPGATMERFALKKALGELFVFPVQGRLTSPFGMRNDPFTGRRMMHNGIDIANNIGTPVRATADGQVIMVGFSSVYGRYIILRHPGNYQSLYAHLDRARVREGDRVVQNQVIGDLGNTGRSTGPHLHFSIYHNQRPIDPLTVLSR